MNAKLAIDGGPKIRATPLPGRQLITTAEKAAVGALFDQAIAGGEQLLGYNGPQEEAYCQEFAAWLGGGFADGVNSGSNAVYVALRAKEIDALQDGQRHIDGGCDHRRVSLRLSR